MIARVVSKASTATPTILNTKTTTPIKGVLHLLHTTYTNVTHPSPTKGSLKQQAKASIEEPKNVCVCLQSEWFIQGLPSPPGITPPG